MDHRDRTILASAGVVLIFLVVQIGALALVEPFQQEGHQVVEDTEDPSWSIYYILAIFIVTGLMLAAMSYGGTNYLRLAIIFAGAYLAFYVFQALMPDPISFTFGEGIFDVTAIFGALVVGAALYYYPEWYVINISGIIMGIGAAGLFGINLNILPVLVLLVGLAIYDAISVYGTEHMLTLASGAMDMRVPVVLVVPLYLSYSFLEDGGPASLDENSDDGSDDGGDDADGDGPEVEGNADGEIEEGSNEENEEVEAPDLDTLEELGTEGIDELEPEQLAAIDSETMAELDDELEASVEDAMPRRDALFIGLGDAVIPTVLVASAAFFVDAGQVDLLVLTANIPALTAMAGTLVGLVILLWMVLKGRAHAGLPLLNGGAIGGYLVGALLSGLTLTEALGLTGLL